MISYQTPGKYEVAQHFSSAKRRDLSTKNPIPSKNIPPEWGGNQDILRLKKTRTTCYPLTNSDKPFLFNLFR